MFKKIVFCMSVAVCLGSCSDARKGCQKFRDGNFSIVDTTINYEAFFERKGKIQTERNIKTGDESKYLVDWISDCEYTLAFLDGSEEGQPSATKILFVTITDYTEDSYNFEMRLEGELGVIKNTMKLIK